MVTIVVMTALVREGLRWGEGDGGGGGRASMMMVAMVRTTVLADDVNEHHDLPSSPDLPIFA